MTSAAFLLLIITITGITVLRSWVRLAPLFSEFPAKTVLATLFSAFAVAGEFGWAEAPGWISTAALIVGPLFVLGPLAALSFTKWGWHPVARALLYGLYWTPDGRNALGGLLAQVALGAGEPTEARAYGGSDPLLPLRLLLAERRYDEALALPNPEHRVADIVARLLKIEALVHTGRTEEAEFELGIAQDFYEQIPPNPALYRELIVAEARIAAARGQVEVVGRLFSQPLVGLLPYTVFDVLAQAAENRGENMRAAEFLAGAAGSVPRGLRAEYQARIQHLGGGAVQVQTKRKAQQAPAVYIMIGVLAAAFLGQLAADQFLGARQISRIIFDSSSLIGAYFLDIPFAPFHDAWWRFLTYAFVHGNVLHIGMNLWVLLDLGRAYETRRSWPYLVTSFVVGTAGGAWLTMVLDTGPLVLVGASGGILGVAGALLADALLSKRQQDRGLVQSLVRWMALLMLISVAVPGISLYGHAGGIVTGFAWGALVQFLPDKDRIMPALGWLGILLMGFSLFEALRSVLPLLQ